MLGQPLSPLLRRRSKGLKLQNVFLTPVIFRVFLGCGEGCIYYRQHKLALSCRLLEPVMSTVCHLVAYADIGGVTGTLFHTVISGLS